MANIIYSDEQCNIFSLNEFFYKRLKDRPYWNFTKDGKVVLCDYGIRKKCDPKIIESALFYEERRKALTKDPNKTWKKLKGFRDILKEREPTDDELREYLKIVKDSLYIIQFEKSDGSTFFSLKFCQASALFLYKCGSQVKFKNITSNK